MASLVKQLDKAVADNEGLHAVVNFVDVDQEDVAKFGTENGIENVALTTTDQANADKLAVNPEAGVTVMNYVGKKVKSNHVVPSGKLDDTAIAAIMDSAVKLTQAEED